MSVRKLVLSLCVAAALALPLAAQTKPDFTGAWKQKDTGTNGPYGIVFRIEHKDPAFKYTATGRTSDGTSFSESYEFTTDGKSRPDSAPVKVVAHWEGETLVLQYSARDTQIAAFTLKLSEGGKQMLRDGTFTGGKTISEVYEKQ